jgi:hypothetical protein
MKHIKLFEEHGIDLNESNWFDKGSSLIIEKANSLVNTFGKELALECVKEIRKERKWLKESLQQQISDNRSEFWHQVESEIKKL